MSLVIQDLRCQLVHCVTKPKVLNSLPAIKVANTTLRIFLIYSFYNLLLYYFVRYLLTTSQSYIHYKGVHTYSIDQKFYKIPACFLEF
ncbi:hypothetical protein CW304_10340 [Bacillus sp. UFRGS-B20]|nr:hypothetical protein CW304_10340 [Bacillus sp. UFRGS-B20]